MSKQETKKQIPLVELEKNIREVFGVSAMIRITTLAVSVEYKGVQFTVKPMKDTKVKAEFLGQEKEHSLLTIKQILDVMNDDEAEITPKSKKTEFNFSFENDLSAVAVVYERENRSSTVIYIQNSFQEIYLESEYEYMLSEKQIETLVKKGFKKCENMRHAPSKYGEDIPTIED
ncbi:MAG: hypothetical protein CL760_09500 [Chloroflexi bacterium]|nr:hypothetical protein [Chloroflexota bacterium]|tara:strand:- start:11522 stop:12043 length:522 start_codon:yes stop_codon:yes gene_type:complete